MNLEEFLLRNMMDEDSYALVTYNGKTESIHFTKYNFGSGDWFLESPCELYKLDKVNEPIDDYCKKYVEMYIDEIEENAEEFINEYMKPMIVDGILYEIDCPQCSPYLPKEVDNIKLISERECLLWILNNQTK